MGEACSLGFPANVYRLNRFDVDQKSCEKLESLLRMLQMRTAIVTGSIGSDNVEYKG